MKKSILVLAVAAIAASAAVTHAESYDQTVANNGGFLYYGTGNYADNFATSTATDASGPVTIGLRAAYNGSTGFVDFDGAGGTYNVPGGAEIGHPANAKWDYVFSIDVGSNLISNYTASLQITDDTTSTTNTAFNPLLIPDNDENSANVYEGPVPENVEQNAEDLTFGVVGLPGFNFNAVNDYTITLTLTDPTLNPSFDLVDTIHVDVVPLPASAWSGLALLGGLGLLGGVGRLRKQMA